MQIRSAVLTLAMLASFTACGGGGSTTPAYVPTSAPVTLAAATSSTCVNAQSTPQIAVLADTGGITASIALAQYDVGATGCQDITIATGADASATESAAANTRRPAAVSSAPIISMTLGEGLPTSLGLATVMSGVTLNTDANLNFPDGTYNATVTIAAYGVNTAVTLSLVFTAVNGKLTITGGTQLPVNLGSGAKLLIYDRGVIPPGFIAPTTAPNASPTASSSASASPSPAPTSTVSSAPTPAATPTPNAGAPVPDNTQIGTFNFTISGLPSGLYGNGVQLSGTIVYTSQPVLNSLQCTQDQTTGNSTCVYTGSDFSADIPSGSGAEPGVMTYTLGGLPARSYRIDGCTGGVAFGGKGNAGTMSTPYRTLTVADNCEVDLFSQPAAVVNASSDRGAEYIDYVVSGPVDQNPPTTNPALDL